MKTKYLHTIDGHPAWFNGEQICFASPRKPLFLADSLQQLRKEQLAAKHHRASKGFPLFFKYGFVVVKV